MKIAVAGAGGFVGQAFIEHILKTTNYEIIAFSRAQRTSKHPRVEWRRVDLFSLLDA